ncbi:transmembrane protein 242-like [Clavelina lepadiformis]|uniref:transmembrane protein 242-like n=1 Tax=Clavelina lepadiformis TaxID=159417 RepID=UPI0040417361
MNNTEEDGKDSSAGPMQSAAFIFGVAGTAALGGFGMMLAQAKKKSPNEFHSGLAPEVGLESGARLAMRALGRATLYSVGGFSLFCFTVWKLMGVQNLKEFSAKMQGIMPKIPPAASSTGEEVNWDEIFGKKSQETLKKE